MKKLIILLFLLSCTPKVYLTNEQIIEEVKKCEDNNMSARYFGGALDLKVRHIICYPKENKDCEK
jgi:hypothetical protein